MDNVVDDKNLGDLIFALTNAPKLKETIIALNFNKISKLIPFSKLGVESEINPQEYIIKWQSIFPTVTPEQPNKNLERLIFPKKL